MFNVRLAGGHLYGKQLFTWLSLVVSLMASFFPLDVLDEIWDLIESVSEGFLTYSFRKREQDSSLTQTLKTFHRQIGRQFTELLKVPTKFNMYVHGKC